MTYKSLLEKVANANNTSVENVDKEIRYALKIANINIHPMTLITIATSKIIDEANK